MLSCRGGPHIMLRRSTQGEIKKASRPVLSQTLQSCWGEGTGPTTRLYCTSKQQLALQKQPPGASLPFCSASKHYCTQSCGDERGSNTKNNSVRAIKNLVEWLNIKTPTKGPLTTVPVGCSSICNSRVLLPFLAQQHAAAWVVCTTSGGSSPTPPSLVRGKEAGQVVLVADVGTHIIPHGHQAFEEWKELEEFPVIPVHEP